MASLTVQQVLRLSPVMPVVVIDDAAGAADLARALIAGGIGVIEITLRTAAALPAIEAIARAVPEMQVGAGTIVTVADLESATRAGASFAISPGSTQALLEAGRAKNAIPYLPGVATASDLMTGVSAGYDCFKFFPAATSGGPAALAALAGPFSQVAFCPTGGISLESAPSYFAVSQVACVGGSWLTPKALLASRDWVAIERHARAAVEKLRTS